MRKTTEKKEIRSDRELLNNYRDTRDLQVLGQLYDRYLELIYGVCLRYLGREDRAEDAVMAIFEELVSKAAEHEVREFRPWLYVLTRNYCLMELRRENRNPEKSIDPSDMQSLDLAHPEDEDADQNERMAALRDCIEALSDDQKDCINRFYLQGMSYKEIADEKNLSLGRVRSHIQNGRRMLKICVEGHENAVE